MNRHNTLRMKTVSAAYLLLCMTFPGSCAHSDAKQALLVQEFEHFTKHYTKKRLKTETIAPSQNDHGLRAHQNKLSYGRICFQQSFLPRRFFCAIKHVLEADSCTDCFKFHGKEKI